MGQEIWTRLRRYLAIWLIAGAGILALALITRWERISAYLSQSAQSSIVSAVMVLTMAGLIISIVFGMLFPRR